MEQHHERYDGSGYPAGLTSDRIGMSGSIGAIVDVYEPITSQWIYRGGLSAEDALKRTYEWRQKDFHAELLPAGAYGINPVDHIAQI